MCCAKSYGGRTRGGAAFGGHGEPGSLSAERAGWSREAAPIGVLLPARTKGEPSADPGLKESGYARPHYGYPQLAILLQRKGRPTRYRRIHGIEREQGPMVRTEQRRRQALESVHCR